MSEEGSTIIRRHQQGTAMGTVSPGAGRKRAPVPAAAKNSRKGPGRPEGESKLKDAILDGKIFPKPA